MSDGLLCHIQRHSWQFFANMTYRNSRTMSTKARRAMQMQWLRRLALIGHKNREGLLYRTRFEDLEWIIREELGEQTQRLHWHALLSGLPPGIVTPNTCMFSMGYWEGIGGGMARVRVYDPEQDAASYVLKGLEGTSDKWSVNGANAYEVGKFKGQQGQEPLMLIVSDSLQAKWKRAAWESRQHALEQQHQATGHENTGRHLARPGRRTPPRDQCDPWASLSDEARSRKRGDAD